MKKIFAVLILSLTAKFLLAQDQPRYTKKLFKSAVDTSFYKIIIPKSNGFMRSFVMVNPRIWDIDDDSTTYVVGGSDGKPVALFIEGNMKNNKRNGIFNFYLADSLNPRKRYRIWQQTFSDDKLMGKWNTYTLNGVLASYLNYDKDSLNGISRDLWIDGKTVMMELEYFGGRKKFIKREYYQNGKIKSETPFENDKLNGVGRKYYENGNLTETVHFTNGEFDGSWKYYHPNGQLWLEKIYKKGKNWTIIANYTKEGKKRNAGTLTNGNGTAIYYNEDGSVRETIVYKEGEVVK